MSILSNIKLFITDIDGVWTDGGMYYDQSGNEWKKFNTSDSAGVLFLKILNIPLAIITGENSDIVKHRARKLKIEYCFLGIKNKVEEVEELMSKFRISWDQVAYIGDDINDIKLLNKVGLSACPEDAADYIKECVDWVIPVKGGDGVFRAFVEKYLDYNKLLSKVIQKYLSNVKSYEQ